MLRTLAFASAVALGTTGIARAQDSGPRLVGGGENAAVVYAEPSRNVVGGGAADMAGGGDNLRITYGPQVTAEASTGLVAELVGGGENAQVVYRQTVPADRMVAAGRAVQPGG